MLRFCWLHVRAVFLFFFCFVFYCCGSNVYLKLTEEYCSCVVKNLNTQVEIMKLYKYIVCLFIYIYIYIMLLYIMYDVSVENKNK